MEKPVIFTALGPGPEIIENLRTGLLCNPLDPKDIASKILWVFEHKEKASEIGKNARLEAIEKFSEEKSIQKNIEFYTRIRS